MQLDADEDGSPFGGTAPPAGVNAEPSASDASGVAATTETATEGVDEEVARPESRQTDTETLVQSDEPSDEQAAVADTAEEQEEA